MQANLKIELITLTQCKSHKKNQSNSTPVEPHPCSTSTSSLSDLAFIMDRMNILLQLSSSMIADIALIKAESQLNRVDCLTFHSESQQQRSTLDFLQVNSYLIGKDVAWIKQYLSHEEAADAVVAKEGAATDAYAQWLNMALLDDDDEDDFLNDSDVDING
ncbi:hypothetical protein CJ030_MR4G023073 [Morella rubra]|uniref:Uncharacterized protein n=1 Tax=Morella rubra TaxID=262757 RepID=A0A6A1VU80_9ROSI|nr:hypothetical protein CJ030_MR4G023073 [Morella rubra]